MDGSARRLLLRLPAVAWLGWVLGGGQIWTSKAAGKVGGEMVRWGMGDGPPACDLAAAGSGVAVKDDVAADLKRRGCGGFWLGGAAAMEVPACDLAAAGGCVAVKDDVAADLKRRGCGGFWLGGAAAMEVEKLGWWPQLGSPDLLFVFLFCVYLHLYSVCLCLIPGIRVIFTLCVLVLCRSRFIIPRMVFVSIMWSKLGFEPPFLREYMLLGIWFFMIWSLVILQETLFCKRIITVADGFAPQSLVGDPVLVVYSLSVFCIFNGVVCLFYGTSLVGDLYVLLIEPFSAVMDFVQFYD